MLHYRSSRRQTAEHEVANATSKFLSEHEQKERFPRIMYCGHFVHHVITVTEQKVVIYSQVAFYLPFSRSQGGFLD